MSSVRHGSAVSRVVMTYRGPGLCLFGKMSHLRLGIRIACTSGVLRGQLYRTPGLGNSSSAGGASDYDHSTHDRDPRWA